MIPNFYKVILDNFLILVVHISGLGVVKRVINHFKSEETYIKVRDLLIENSLMLVQNPYGNYAIQVAVEVSLHFHNFFHNIEMGRFFLKQSLYEVVNLLTLAFYTKIFK